MSADTKDMTTTLINAEDGYAEVLNANSRRIGTVSREKHGSTRTGTRWFAHRGNTEIGSADTRAAAVQLLVDHAAQREAQIAAFKAGA